MARTYQLGDILINRNNEECEVIAVLNHFIRIRNTVTGVKECYQIFPKPNSSERKVTDYEHGRIPKGEGPQLS